MGAETVVFGIGMMYVRSRSVFVDTEIEKTPINGYELLPVKEIYISIG